MSNEPAVEITPWPLRTGEWGLGTTYPTYEEYWEFEVICPLIVAYRELTGEDVALVPDHKVFWSDEDEMWIAHVTTMPSMSAFGSTPAEAVDELYVALDDANLFIGNDGKVKRRNDENIYLLSYYDSPVLFCVYGCKFWALSFYSRQYGRWRVCMD